MNRPEIDRDALLEPLLGEFHRLERALQELNAALEHRLVDAAVFQIPFVRDDDADEARKDAAESGAIPVTPATGLHALRLAQRCFAALKRQNHQPPTRADRLPGYVITENPDLPRLAAEVNAAKTRFKARMLALPDAVDAPQDLFPGSDLQHLMLLQVYRLVDLFDQPLRALTFGWTGGSAVVSQLTREEARRLILNTASGEDEEDDRWLALLDGSDSPYFARIKPMPPTPIANLALMNDTLVEGRPEASPWLPRHAVSMPLILFRPGTPEIKRLESYRAEAETLPIGLEQPAVPTPQRSGRARLTADEPLIAPLRLYAYKPEAYAQVIAARERRDASRSQLAHQRLQSRETPFDPL